MREFFVEIKEKTSQCFDTRSIALSMKAENPGEALSEVIEALKVNPKYILSTSVRTVNYG